MESKKSRNNTEVLKLEKMSEKILSKKDKGRGTDNERKTEKI
jgi:hypothetical protein